MVKNRTELFLVIRIAGFCVALLGMMRTLGIRELVEKITPLDVRRKDGFPAADRIMYLCERMMRLLQRAGYKYTCLRRSMVMYHFLRLSGTPVSINFGAMWIGENLTGHSWLSLGGDVLFDRPENVSGFVHFFSLPEDGRATVPPEGKEMEYLNKTYFD